MIVICPLSVVPIRETPSHKSQQVSQLLLTETAQVIDNQGEWLQIRTLQDDYQGWVVAKQVQEIPQNLWKHLQQLPPKWVASPFAIGEIQSQKIAIPLGANAQFFEFLQIDFQGDTLHSPASVTQIALMFLNAPYLWGGKSLAGIDCSGFVQIVFRLCGVNLPRDAYQQQTQGISVSFEEISGGDVAFFCNSEQRVTHTGIILDDKTIIHAHAKVRIDTLTPLGIFDETRREYTHTLHSIKRYL